MFANLSRKVYLAVNNQRGNTNTSGMVWIIGGVVLFAVIFAFAKGWIPKLLQIMEQKVNEIL